MIGGYRGKEGQWAFVLHRISGLAILLYLLLHILSIGSIAISRDAYEAVHAVESHWLFSMGLVFVTAGVLYHALNGLRIIFMDFAGWGVKIQRELFYVVLVISAIGGILTGVLTLMRVLAEHGG
ncbi:succinate dehydrogenase, cytochrome b556 subunit [Deinococcus cellulosilyticus]|uniref:Succinate dehydrogenase, cytochrome b556 subunit n=1 Tax=Deinococcus cellulosilyticus (strain DSM 18568 / NBRC 106333 / KACC 11606 / 5516J-15) TaxID=1223518 RepID=A0A511MXA2_DEIC1|nr:succinate dehydrogenase, cytochrome b556 subunit [Deinococcus cellulosilyticus]GEM45190.1 succinate dehydrogenase, cytochrome b556 subunit [Deinococcus cellulosilyticus NBRC 106333 = KACC 11606]